MQNSLTFYCSGCGFREWSILFYLVEKKGPGMVVRNRILGVVTGAVI